MWKELLKSLLATLKSVLSRTSNARLGGLILGQIPHCKLQSNARGMPAGGEGRFWYWLVHYFGFSNLDFAFISKIWKWIMNLKNPYSNSNLSRRFTKSGCAEGIIHAFCWVRTRKKYTFEIVFLRKCQALCFRRLRLRVALSTIPEQKWGTTRSLLLSCRIVLRAKEGPQTALRIQSWSGI